MEISWTPGHADIKGNDQADRLAKEAAHEAKEMSELPLNSNNTMWQKHPDLRNGKRDGRKLRQGETCSTSDQGWTLR